MALANRQIVFLYKIEHLESVEQLLNVFGNY